MPPFILPYAAIFPLPHLIHSSLFGLWLVLFQYHLLSGDFLDSGCTNEAFDQQTS